MDRSFQFPRFPFKPNILVKYVALDFVLGGGGVGFKSRLEDGALWFHVFVVFSFSLIEMWHGISN
jgi:hypothetical protein